MPDPARRARERAGEVVDAARRRAERTVSLRDRAGRAAERELLVVLRRADRQLGQRLQIEARRHGSMDARFTGAQALGYRQQVRAAIGTVQGQLSGITSAQQTRATRLSWDRTGRLLADLEERFAGSVMPLRMQEARALLAVDSAIGGTLLRQRATSVDRYGLAMVREMERSLAIGQVSGFTQQQMVDALVGMRGPRGMVSTAATVRNGLVVRLSEERMREGLFVRHRSWAERIVRTETARAYNLAGHASMIEAHREFPDLQRVILATFDSRTAMDSVLVHGQIRGISEPFTDGAGRVYMVPPARPNDRETVIPYRRAWPREPSTLPLSQSRIERLARQLGARHPPRHRPR